MTGRTGGPRQMASTDNTAPKGGRTRNGATALVLLGVVGGMVGLSFASVPLYQLFCKVTGYGGTPACFWTAPAPAK